MLYVWMLQSFGDRSLYLLSVLQSPWAKVGPWVLGPGCSVTALALGLTGATELPAQAVQRGSFTLQQKYNTISALSAGLCEEQR